MEDAQIGPYDPARGALGFQFEKRAGAGASAYLSGVAFFLRDHTVLALFAAPPERATDVRAAAALLWEQSRIDPVVLPPRAQEAAFNRGRQIGVVLGSLLGGALLILGLSWLLLKLGLSSRRAVGSAGMALVCSAALIVILRGSLDMMLQLACYVLVGALAYAWLPRWFERRPRKGFSHRRRAAPTA